MRYFALATDYDGTLAHNGVVSPATVAALERLRATGRKLLLVTGRELPDLLRVFPRLDLFDRVVAENGALIYCPATREEQPLGEAPPDVFINALRELGVAPLSVGRVIVATWHPNEELVLTTIRDLGLELQVIFNKGAVMVLPSGINKAAGLSAALAQLGLSPHNVVGIGDAENDHAFMRLCECAVAVSNALPMVQERADYVTAADHGAGVVELIDMIIVTDLAELAPRLENNALLLGTRADDDEQQIHIKSYGTNTVGDAPEQAIRAFSAALQRSRDGGAPREQRLSPIAPIKLEAGEALVWSRASGEPPFRLRIAPPRGERRRHLRKYAEGNLGADKSFYFRGPSGKLNLRAQNLVLFNQIAEGVDDETWLFHLRQGDYARWFRESIKDEALADEAARIAEQPQIGAAESRAAIKAAIEERYTAAA